MDNININNLSTTRLLASYNDNDRLFRKLLTKKDELINRLFGKGRKNEIF